MLARDAVVIADSPERRASQSSARDGGSDIDAAGRHVNSLACAAYPARVRSDDEWYMQALSIRQPYAEMILRGEKTIEYRSRPTPIDHAVDVGHPLSAKV